MIYEILTVSCFALLFAELTPFVANLKIKLGLKRLNPFDCPLCLSFWAGLAYSLTIPGLNLELIFIPPVLTTTILLWIKSK